jgi:hypothetical protein
MAAQRAQQPHTGPEGMGQDVMGQGLGKGMSMGQGMGQDQGWGQLPRPGSQPGSQPTVAPKRRKPVRRPSTVALGTEDERAGTGGSSEGPGWTGGGGSSGGGGDMARAMAGKVDNPQQIAMYEDADKARGW